MKFYDRLIFLTKYLPYFSIKFNTRLRLNDEDKDIEDPLMETKIKNKLVCQIIIQIIPFIINKSMAIYKGSCFLIS